MNRNFIIITLSMLMALASTAVNSEINKNRPPFSLTLEQALQWSEDSNLADRNNVSAVDLQPKFVAQLDSSISLDANVKVLIAPDGMNNLANYITEQDKFNLYNFTHWSQIDVLNWFAGTANETVNIPARPWVETAHRNGVKVIGTIYLAVAQYGGNVETVATLLQQDSQGRFPFAHQLVEIANFYGFDGWLINPETDLTAVKNAQGQVVDGAVESVQSALLGKKMQDFMRYLTQLAPTEMEIHWYDAMLLDGSVKWQNQLNASNSPFLQESSAAQDRVSDAMFINYWWNADMVSASNQYLSTLNRSPYELYFGVDLSPERDAQHMFTRSAWLHALFPGKGEIGLSSIALFANDVNFTFVGNKHTPAFSSFIKDGTDHRGFYDSETRLFAGDDLNLAVHDDSSHWPGLGRYIPSKSTLTTLPFSTSFNTGHGKLKAQQGNLVVGEWHDISKQDILPTWQFAIQGEGKTSVFYDFEQAYMGGNSLAIRSNKNLKTNIIPLYQTAFLVNEHTQLELTFQHNVPSESLSLWLQTTEQKLIKVALISADNKWHTLNFDLAKHAGKTIERIGFTVDEHPLTDLSTNIGLLEIK